MLLEAQLIKNYQPQFNILLKSGQPYLYLFFSQTKIPELKLVRTKNKPGKYFGPFLEKGPARRAHTFLLKTFRLKLCNKKIPNGCLYYHLGTCAGSCRDDFDKNAYLERLELAKKSLEKGHKKFLKYLQEKIEEYSQELLFEKSKEFHGYLQAFEKVFLTIQTKFSSKEKSLSHKHIWVLHKNMIFLFDEHNGITKKKEIFFTNSYQGDHLEYFESYYQTHDCTQTILTNFAVENAKNFEKFLQKWHKKSFPIDLIIKPESGHMQSLLQLAKVHAKQEFEKIGNLNLSLKKLLKLPTEPHTIDCFDVSHKQGMDMVGSCIRFVDGKPDKENFRKFKIKTVEHQDDYACLQEIVQRRYKDKKEIPDLILIDGGKGQLNAILSLFPDAECASLAKREETIFSKRIPEGKKINVSTFAGQALIALRDYAHHFAISYHRKLARKVNR